MPATSAPFQHQRSLAGTVVSVERSGYRHVGLVAEAAAWGDPQVISLNPGSPGQQVRQEPLAVFARGKPVRVEPLTSPLAPSLVLARARAGQHPPYSWTTFNCEHFVRYALGLAVESPQVRAWAVAAGLGLFMWAAARAKG